MSDLAGDVSECWNSGEVKIDDDDDDNNETRSSVSNLRRIYPRKASRRLLPAPSIHEEDSVRSATESVSRQPLVNRQEQPSFITGARSHARGSLYCASD